ncbi:hypothetical protein Dip510_000834 [Elusimicrobium posterum]|uniref:Bbp19 family protein n=1 Tax=Elusimicrobium posterum TaxID=3116653 RepID=UPI003C760184
MSEKENKSEVREQEVLDLLNVLRTESGRRVIWKVINVICGTFDPAFTGSSTTFYNQGKREAGLQLLSEVLEINGGEYFLMMKREAGENK